MSAISTDPANADQIAYWNGPGGANWVARQEAQDAQLAPVSAALLARAAVKARERIVDVGCGAGATTEELGRLVGAGGHVLGIDVSAPMLERARRRLKPDLPVEFVQGDATTYAFERADVDLLFSRFGVMFFAEPARTFANLRAALKPGGRLVFMCWRSPEENDWVMVALRAAYAHVPPLPKVGPEDPGMFSFAREDRVRRVLGEAGFRSVALEPFGMEIDVGRGRGLDEAVANAAQIGPASRTLEGAPPETVAAVHAAIRQAYARRQRGSAVPLPAAMWLVTAQNP
ncbi:MAG TPA: methyltransferase domain-containing protein [Stellaceae bacterium]|nr:methyltransferase domain-containing protein [Stellaceae bacterium]